MNCSKSKAPSILVEGDLLNDVGEMKRNWISTVSGKSEI